MNTIFTHFTCALDTRNVAVVVTAVRAKLLERQIDEIADF